MVECSPNSVCLSLGFGVCVVKVNICKISALFELFMSSICNYMSGGNVCGVVLYHLKTMLTFIHVFWQTLTRKWGEYESRVKPPDAYPGMYVSSIFCCPNWQLRFFACWAGIAEDNELVVVDKNGASEACPCWFENMSKLPCHGETDRVVVENGEAEIFWRLAISEFAERDGAVGEWFASGIDKSAG